MVQVNENGIYVLTSEVYNMDCMELMKRYPDKYFDLSVCDPPYGINVGKMNYLQEKKTKVKQKNGNYLNANKNKKLHTFKNWDEKMLTQEYFDELKRISKNQIIFGIEYVNWKGVGTGKIKWKKGVASGVSFKPYEMAYCSMIDFEIELPLLWAGMCQAKSLSEPMTQQGNKALNEKRIHPTQKPVLLYDWIFKNYAKEGDKILDTHLGSASSRIAAHKAGLHFVGCEIDKEYFDDAQKRYQQFISQLRLF